MESLWNDAEAALASGRFGPLGLRVYSSRLLGRDPSLVLHGGGNTSVKLTEADVFGEPQDVLYVKGSGWDLASIEPAGFAPLRLDPVRRLASLPALSDLRMVSELSAQLLRPDAPAPSVETILHAILPHAYVDHTHADAVLSISNSPDGESRIRDIYGAKAVVIPYVMPGFDLAAHCARAFPHGATKDTIGMVLLSHGVFSFGADARQAYERMIELVSMAEKYLAARKAWNVDPAPAARARFEPLEAARLRSDASRSAGFPLLCRCNDANGFLAFARHPDAPRISQGGPATPDHVIRTKRVPMLGRDVGAFGTAYRGYFSRNEPRAKERKAILDPAPRAALDPQFGLVALGRTAKDVGIVEDIYAHTVRIILRAEALGGWRALDEAHVFDVEYWDLEQAKLKKAGAPAEFAGEIAIVTGAASGIGKACVEAFLKRGAAVAALDRDPAVEARWRRPEVLPVVCDLADAAQVEDAIARAVKHFGGADMLVLNAGVFPPSEPVQSIAPEKWRQAMTVNLDASLRLLQLCHPLLRLAPRGGRVVVIGSKNVPAPGPGAGAYSASKAALNQLARVAALEWGKDGIRVNSLHPNAVYDTALWTPEVLAARAKAYGLSVEQYRTNNVLRTEVSSKDVAELAAEMCGPLFAKTTGAQLPVDGGNERVI